MGGLLCNIKIKRLTDTAKVPARTYKGDAGYDLFVSSPATVLPGQKVDVNTGIAIAMKDGFYARIIGRSSTTRNLGLFVIEGIIDNGYRGELSVGVVNFNNFPVELELGQRIAQLIIAEQVSLYVETVQELPASKDGRCENGYGSTGK